MFEGNIFNIKDLYPTPQKLIDKMLQDIDWYEILTILEPSTARET